MLSAEKYARKKFKAKVLARIPQGTSEELASRTYHEDLEQEGLVTRLNGKWELTPEGQRVLSPITVSPPPFAYKAFAYGD